MKRIIAIAIIIFSLIGCGKNPNQIIGTIINISDDAYLPYSIEGKPSGIWHPSEEIIKKANPVIFQYINDSSKEIFRNIDLYRCQYFGIIIKGKKRLYCNFFRLTAYEKDWRTNPVVVFDGGNCYFQLEYDIETGKCLNFSINGEA